MDKELAIGIGLAIWLGINVAALVYAVRVYFKTWKR